MNARNIRISYSERVTVKIKDGKVRLETEDEGCTAIVFLSVDQAQVLVKNLTGAMIALTADRR